MKDENQRRAAIEHVGELIGDIPVAMLTTCGGDHVMRSRPMVNINSSFQGELWFFTASDDPKVEEIRANPQLNVAFAAPQQQYYVSVSGTGSIVEDKKRCELLWTAECEPWFPNGPSAENLALIKVEVQRAEYWDAKRKAMVAIAGFFQNLAGGQPSPTVKHDKLDWEQSAVPPGAESSDG